MKTAVSIPDDLFRQADAIARRSRKSRSQVYREALEEYLRRRDPHAVTSALDEMVTGFGGERDRWVEQTGRGALERTEW